MANITEINGSNGKSTFTLPAEGVVLHELERELLRQALERTTGNRTHAARLLGLSRNQLRYRMRKFGLERAFLRPGPAHAEPAWAR